MDNLAKNFFTCLTAFIIMYQLNAYFSIMPSRNVLIPRDLSKLAWANKHTAFLSGERPTIEGTQMHDICFEEMRDEVEQNHPNGRIRATVTGAAYMSCYGRMIEERLSRLCSDDAKKRYLTRLSAYLGERAIDIKQDETWQKMASTSNNQVFLAVSGYASPGDSHDPTDFAVDSRLVSQLDHFVEIGLLSKKKDLAPIMDVAVLAKAPSDKEVASARTGVCN